MWCDGRRRFDLPPGARVEVRRGSLPVLLARVHARPTAGRRPAAASSPTGWSPSSACRSRAGEAAPRGSGRVGPAATGLGRRALAVMLEEVRITGLGVIDDALLELSPGFTALTGETGAGKTMVVTGLGMLFGGRADPARIRPGAQRATVEGRLRTGADGKVAQQVEEAGGELDEDGTLVLTRSVSAEGRSRASAGGRSVPVSLLTYLADDLVAVHGQSDQQQLLKPGRQREALDKYARRRARRGAGRLPARLPAAPVGEGVAGGDHRRRAGAGHRGGGAAHRADRDRQAPARRRGRRGAARRGGAAGQRRRAARRRVPGARGAARRPVRGQRGRRRADPARARALIAGRGRPVRRGAGRAGFPAIGGGLPAGRHRRRAGVLRPVGGRRPGPAGRRPGAARRAGPPDPGLRLRRPVPAQRCRPPPSQQPAAADGDRRARRRRRATGTVAAVLDWAARAAVAAGRAGQRRRDDRRAGGGGVASWPPRSPGSPSSCRRCAARPPSGSPGT